MSQGTRRVPTTWLPCAHRIKENVMKSVVNRFVRDDNGQDLIEYALLAGFISLVAVVAITNVGTGVNAVYTNIDSQVKTIPAGTGS
jgi:pilus assembly protein Flp/PilA